MVNRTRRIWQAPSGLAPLLHGQFSEQPSPRSDVARRDVVRKRRCTGRGMEPTVVDLHVEEFERDKICSPIVGLGPDMLLIDTMTPTMAYARRKLQVQCCHGCPSSKYGASVNTPPNSPRTCCIRAHPSPVFCPGIPRLGSNLLACRGERPVEQERGVWIPMAKSCAQERSGDTDCVHFIPSILPDSTSIGTACGPFTCPNLAMYDGATC